MYQLYWKIMTTKVIISGLVKVCTMYKSTVFLNTIEFLYMTIGTILMYG